jgi:hypothetical protein
VAGASLAVTAMGSEQPADIQELGDGRYALSYLVAASQPPGPLTWDISSSGASLARADGPSILPYWRSWGLSVGAYVAAQTNFSFASAFSPRLTLGLRMGRSDFELIAEADHDFYAAFTNAKAHSGDTTGGTSLSGTLSGTSARVGGRYSIPIGQRTAFHGAVLLGLHSTSDTVTANGQSVSDPRAWGLDFRAAGGVTYWLGRNRLLAQLEYALQPAPNQSHIYGNLGGFSAAVGYIFCF